MAKSDIKPETNQPLSVDQLNKKIESLSDPEEKLQVAIAYMEQAIKQRQHPNFKVFWEARKLSLDLLKDKVPAGKRGVYWEKYAQLSQEGRELKKIVEEQSAFAAEQIDSAISALESEMDVYEKTLNHIDPVQWDRVPKFLKNKLSSYRERQKELNLLNAYSVRINALRKELIPTDMRISVKNKLFKRLSLVGDKIFPRRKELIKSVSQDFVKDVETFAKKSLEKIQGKLVFSLREEIKAFQSFARKLTLDTKSFNLSRKILSEGWDKLKELDKEFKKELAKKKSVFQENAKKISEEIKEFADKVAELSIAQGEQKLKELHIAIKRAELGRDEVKQLQQELKEARIPLVKKQEEEEKKRQKLAEEKEQKRKEAVLSIYQKTEELLKGDKTVEEIEKERDLLLHEVRRCQLTKKERLDIDKKLKSLRDLIAKKKEEALLDLPEDKQKAIQQLCELLQQKQELRREVKAQLDTYKRESVASGFDFAQALVYTEQINSEKARLKEIDQSIKELEQKISSLKK